MCIRDSTNADRGSKERIAQIYACAGANRIKVEEMVAGDIGCTEMCIRDRAEDGRPGSY